MGEWLESLLFSAGAVLAMWALYRVATWLDGRKSDERRRWKEHEEWRHR